MENPIPSQPKERKDVLIIATAIIVVIALVIVMVLQYIGQLENLGPSNGQSSPPSVAAYVSIKITNDQNVATAKNFDQLINVNWSQFRSYLNTNLKNAAFFSSTDFNTSSELYAWVENGASSTNTSSNVWVNLSSNIVPAHGQLTIYLAFLDKNTGWSHYFGEAPLLSSTYGGYDNGQYVFPFYDNFAGSSLNTSKWSAITVGSAYYLVNNGIAIIGSSSNSYEHIVTRKTFTGIFQAFLVETTTNSWGGSGMALDAQLPSSSGGYYGWNNSYLAFLSDNRPVQGSGSRLQIVNNSTDSGLAYSSMQEVTSYMSTLEYNGNTLAWDDYFTPLVSANIGEIAQRYHMEMWVGGDLTNTESALYQFARIIPLLPDGVMPTVSISNHANAYPQSISESSVIGGISYSLFFNAHAGMNLSLNVSESKK